MVDEIGELRKWSAEFMGWHIGEQESELIPEATKPAWFNADGKLMVYAAGWHPDNPISGQIYLIKTRLLELGYMFEEMASPAAEPSGLTTIQGRLKEQFYHARVAKMSRGGNWPGPWQWHSDPNPCTALLKAARAAMEG